MTTFASGPVVVTQVTPARRSSTRSLHGRGPSTRGGPVHVVEVEADGITTPTVEIESPSRSRVSLRGSGFTPSDSSTSSVRFELHQKNESNSEARTEPHLSSHPHSESHAASEHTLQQIPTVALTQEMPNIQLQPPAPLTQGSTLPRPAKVHTTTLPQTAILHTALPPPPHTISYNLSPSHPTSSLTTDPSNIPHVSLTIPHLQSNPDSQHPVPGSSQHVPSSTLPRNLTLSRLASQVHSAPDPQDYTGTFTSQPLSVPQSALPARGMEGSQDGEQHSQARPQPPRDPGPPPGTHTLHQHSTLPENISIKLHSTFR